MWNTFKLWVLFYELSDVPLICKLIKKNKAVGVKNGAGGVGQWSLSTNGNTVTLKYVFSSSFKKGNVSQVVVFRRCLHTATRSL